MKKLTTAEFIERAKQIHGDIYDYSKVEYVDANTPVTIICRKHGAFVQSPSNHFKGHGCSQCNRVDKRKMDVAEFIDKVRQIHGDKYDYSNVVYENSKAPVCLICPVHGEFMQSPNKHLQGHGCPKCAKNYKDDTASFIAKARGIHGDFYDYSKVDYVDQHTKVCIIDSDYGEFWQEPNAHLNGRGNPHRREQKAWWTQYNNGRLHKTEKKVYELLVDRFGESDVIPQYWSEKYPFSCDFYVASLDLYIELNAVRVHGGHWFDSSNPDDVLRLAEVVTLSKSSVWYKKFVRVWTKDDVAKRAVAIKNNLNYLVFWNNNLRDFHEWYDNFDFDNPVLRNI